MLMFQLSDIFTNNDFKLCAYFTSTLLHVWLQNVSNRLKNLSFRNFMRVNPKLSNLTSMFCFQMRSELGHIVSCSILSNSSQARKMLLIITLVVITLSAKNSLILFWTEYVNWYVYFPFWQPNGELISYHHVIVLSLNCFVLFKLGPVRVPFYCYVQYSR